MLIEESRLDLNEKVSHYLPDLNLPVKGRELCVKDLLWHTSGLPNFVNAKEKAAIAEFKKKHSLEYLNNATHAQWLTDDGPSSCSGTGIRIHKLRVCTADTNHRSHRRRVVLRLSKRRIFDVLKMSETTDSTRFNGSGNMGTTLVDYTTWDRALWERDPRLLSADGYKLLFTQGALITASRSTTDSVGGWNTETVHC